MSNLLKLILVCVFPASLIQAIDPFVFGSFVKTATYSVAIQQSYFLKQGLNVTYSQIPNSTFGYSALLQGRYDLLLGAVDNVLNRRWNSGQPLSLLGQQDQGPDFVLYAVPSITSIAQLKGKPLLVDSPVSGYAYALQRILSLNGLYLASGDYSFTTVGGSDLRYAALISGTYQGAPVYATMMNWPFTQYGLALPAAQRPNILARASDYIYPYPSNSFTVKTAAACLPSTRDKIVRFLAAMLQANRYLHDVRNKHSSVTAIASTLNISRALAIAQYKAVVDPLTGETTTAQAQCGGFELNRPGILNIMNTRFQFDGWNTNVSRGFNFTSALVPGRGNIIDYSLRDEALTRLY